MDNLKIVNFKIQYLKQCVKIYRNSFPKEERFPVILLLLNIIRGNSKLYLLLRDEEVLAFLYVIDYKSSSFILYLAVSEQNRRNGYGSYLLKWYLNNNRDRNISLNIEEVSSQFKDYNTRLKRLNFYLTNGFYDTNYVSYEKDINFNILSTQKDFDCSEYIKLDSAISKWFFNAKSKIK